LGILVSGDVGFFSLAQTIAGKLPDCQVERYCGISSLVYFAAKLGMAWEDAKIISMHGRNQNLVRAVREHKKVFALTGGENSVAKLCAQLMRTVWARCRFMQARICLIRKKNSAGVRQPNWQSRLFLPGGDVRP
jgi:precorrin-6B methylase 1